jgi:tRNA(Ile)-lysidine synthase
MRWRTGRFVRPLLGLRREVTAAACAALGLEPWDDPHNADLTFQRVRLRSEVLPLLEDVLQGGVVEALGRTAELLRDDLDALDELSVINRDWWSPGQPNSPVDHGDLDVAAVAPLPRAIRTRVLRAWALGAGATELSAAQIASLDALITDWHGQGPIDLPGGVRASRVSGRLEVDRPH